MKFEKGERVLLFDLDGTLLREPQVCTVAEQIGDRLYVFLDSQPDYVRNGNIRRFRKLTKLDEALK